MKNIDREIYIEIEQHFRKKEAALDRLEELLEKTDSADKQTSAFTEPLEKQDEPQDKTPDKSEPEKPGKLVAKAKAKAQDNGQVPGQMTLDDVQANKEPKKP